MAPPMDQMDADMDSESYMDKTAEQLKVIHLQVTYLTPEDHGEHFTYQWAMFITVTVILLVFLLAFKFVIDCLLGARKTSGAKDVGDGTTTRDVSALTSEDGDDHADDHVIKEEAVDEKQDYFRSELTVTEFVKETDQVGGKHQGGHFYENNLFQ